GNDLKAQGPDLAGLGNPLPEMDLHLVLAGNPATLGPREDEKPALLGRREVGGLFMHEFLIGPALALGQKQLPDHVGRILPGEKIKHHVQDRKSTRLNSSHEW